MYHLQNEWHKWSSYWNDPAIGRNRTNVWDIVGIISLASSLTGDDVQGFAQVEVLELTSAESKQYIVLAAADIAILEGEFVELPMTVFSGDLFLLQCIFEMTSIQDLWAP